MKGEIAKTKREKMSKVHVVIDLTVQERINEWERVEWSNKRKKWWQADLCYEHPAKR